MVFEYNSDELDTETAVELLNRLAREHPRREGLTYLPLNEIEGDEFSPEHLQYYHPLAEPITHAIDGRVAELFEETTFLSEEESHVISLKELGLTHGGISMWYYLTSEGVEKSTVDEYSRRARQKFLKAKRTVDELKPLYGGDE